MGSDWHNNLMGEEWSRSLFHLMLFLTLLPLILNIRWRKMPAVVAIEIIGTNGESRELDFKTNTKNLAFAREVPDRD